MADLSVPEGKWLGTLKMGDKGQIVIPKAVRDMFGVKPGDSLLLLADEERGIALVPSSEYKKFVEQIDVNSILGAPPIQPE